MAVHKGVMRENMRARAVMGLRGHEGSKCKHKEKSKMSESTKGIEKAERSLRIATLNANGIKEYGEQLLAFFARLQLGAMVIQNVQIRQDTVLNRYKFSRGAVKAHIVRSGDRFHSQLIIVRQELEASVCECDLTKCLVVELSPSHGEEQGIALVTAYT